MSSMTTYYSHVKPSQIDLMKQLNHTKTMRMHLIKAFTVHALSKFGLCHCKRLIPLPLNKNALPPHKYPLPSSSLTQRIPKTDLAVFISSDSASRPSSVFPNYFKKSLLSFISTDQHAPLLCNYDRPGSAIRCCPKSVKHT